MSKKLVKIINIEEENLHIFTATLVISMIFSAKIWLMIISKVTKKQSFTLSLENTFYEKPEEGSQIGTPTYLGLTFFQLERELG